MKEMLDMREVFGMNCREFAIVVKEMPRAASPENPADLRAEWNAAQAHASACEACATALAEQRDLSRSLHEYAQRAARWDAPPRVEAEVMAQFRQKYSKPQPSPQPFLTSAGYWGYAAAAMLILIVAAFLGVASFLVSRASFSNGGGAVSL